MMRSIAALLFAGCVTFQMWGQTSPANPATTPPAAQPPAEGSAQGGQAEAQPEPVATFPLDKFKEFSAIMEGGPLPGTEDPIHIYRSGNLMRMEALEGKSYQITDFTKHDTHGITSIGCLKYPKVYVRSFPFSLGNPVNKFGRVPIGKDTFDGHSVQIEDLVITLPKSPTPMRLRLWEADDLQGFPIKIETRGGPVRRTILYKNVVLGPQDPTLFIFPETCQDSDKTIGKPETAKPQKTPLGKKQ